MTEDHTYKVVTLVGTSKDSVDDAIKQAVGQADNSVRHMRWFEVDEIRGHISDGEVAHYQVKVDIGFTLEE